MLFGLSFFVLGSLINALTPTVNGLIAGRTIQGAGAGFIMSLGTTLTFGCYAMGR